MDEFDDNDLYRLGELDPLLRVAPPAPGSTRYEAIREKAMTQTTIRTESEHRPAVASRRRFITWGAVVTGAAAAAVAAVVVSGTSGTPSTPSAGDGPKILLAAAQRTAEVKSFRFVQPAQGGGKFGATGEVSGDRSRVVATGEGTTSTSTIVDGVRYSTTAEGKTTRERLSGKEKPAPFAEAAADVVRAVTGAADVVTVGTEPVRGADATHYRLSIKERVSAADPESPLASLPDNELAWFDWEGIGSYTGVTIDVWVADGLIRRISGATPGQDPLTTTEFFDFNTPVKITAPAAS